MIRFASASDVEKVHKATGHEFNESKCNTKFVESIDVNVNETHPNLRIDVDGSVEELKLGMVFTSKKKLSCIIKVMKNNVISR